MNAECGNNINRIFAGERNQVKYNAIFLKKIKVVTLGILILSMFCAIISTSGLAGRVNNSNKITAEQFADKIIRLHVIANSNSPEDQQLKLKVRDAIVSEFNSKFQHIDDITLSRKLIQENLTYIETLAKDVIEKSGQNYEVKAVFGKFPFPTKTYGYVTLPAGEYEALRVIIGSGKGANWWCVLFPPLCFVDITQGESKDKTTFAKSPAETQQELKVIEAYKSANDQIEIRFKLQELWQETKGKLNRAVRLALK